MTFTTWGRVEPHAQTTDIEAGLAAEVADPLWLLGRQLQVGELTGTDAGSAVLVDVACSWSRFTRLRAAGSPPGPTVHLDSTTGPLEPLVEGEAVLAVGAPDDRRAGGWAARIRAGRTLSRMLTAAGLGATAARMAHQEPTTFAPPPPGADDVHGVDDDRYRTLLAGRAIDAIRVLALQGNPLPPALTAGLDAAAQKTLQTTLDRWASQVTADWGLGHGASAGSPSWIPDRLEYAFSIAAPPLPGTAGEVTLSAPSYDGTGITWSSLDLDVDPASALGAAADTGSDELGPRVASRTRPLLATPLSFPGMPAERFWEMEDAAVALGDVSAGPTDLVRLLAIDFAVLFADDWLLAPVEVPVGCVARIDWVVVRDTFGCATLVGTADSQAKDNAGKQFEPSSANGDTAEHALLVVPPASLGAMRSEVLEDVSFQRDEGANLGWAIERVVMGPTGRGIQRPWSRSEFELPKAGLPPDQYELVWRLATPVAPTWVPLVERAGEGGLRLLVRARLLDTMADETRGAHSRLLLESDSVRDEEVSKAGCRVTIVEKLARSHDGRTFAWRGREKRAGPGEASSGLGFDKATPKET